MAYKIGRAVRRRLPRGPRDALFQLGLFITADLFYEIVRGIVEGRDQVAFANARAIVGIERALGLFFEPGLQAGILSKTWLIEAANWAYMNTHFFITTAFLIWLYLARNNSFYFVRNMFLVAMAMALVGYMLVPTAPPRMLASMGFIDTVAEVSSVSNDSTLARILINPYAAMPSMHMAFALLISVPAAMLVRNIALKALWALYPALVFFVIIVTANHFWLDALAGALVAGASALTAHRLLSKARPAAWAWQKTRPERVTA